MDQNLAKIGCNTKVHHFDLRDILQKNLNHNIVQNWDDYTEFGESYAFSIDTVGMISLDDLELSVSSSIIHCINDVLCGGFMPKNIGASLAFNPEKFNPQKIGAVVSFLNNFCKDHSLKLGKSHTMYSDDNLLTFMCIGERAVRFLDIISDVSYDIILTKKLGAARAYSLNSITEQSRSVKCETRSSLMQDHASVIVPDIKFLHVVTDVSGNGLIGTAYLICKKHNLDVELKLDCLNYYGSMFGSVPISCSSNKNRESFSQYIEKIKTPDDCLEEVLFSSEFSGPLLLLVPSDKGQNIISELNIRGFVNAHKVGTAKSSESSPVVRLI